MKTYQTVLSGIVEAGDVVITQGAGNIGRLAQELATVDFLQELAE